MTRNLPTSLILYPRDEPCYKINPSLWEEFKRYRPAAIHSPEFYSEACCVQYLDEYYDSLNNNSDITVELGHTIAVDTCTPLK